MFGNTWHESHQQHEQPPWEGIADAVQQSHGRLSALLGDLGGRREEKVIIDYTVCFISCVGLHYTPLYQLKLAQSWNKTPLCYSSSDYIHVNRPQVKFLRYLSVFTLKFTLKYYISNISIVRKVHFQAFAATSSHQSVSIHSQNDYPSLWHQGKGLRSKRENIKHPWKHHM